MWFIQEPKTDEWRSTQMIGRLSDAFYHRVALLYIVCCISVYYPLRQFSRYTIQSSSLHFSILSPGSQSAKTWSFYKPACFLAEKNIWYRGDANFKALEWKLKHFYKYLHIIQSTPLIDQTFFSVSNVYVCTENMGTDLSPPVISVSDSHSL